MLKKIICFALTCSIMTAQAAAMQSPLKSAFQKLNYTLEVEWDKKDQAFKNEAIAAFNAEIQKIKAENNLNDAEVVEFLASQVKNEAVAHEIRTAYSMMEINKMSPEATSQFLAQTVTKTVNQGAAWSSEAGLILGVVLLAVLIAAAGGGSGSGGSDCYDEYVCYDYYDDWGYLYTDCGYETYCY